MKKHLITALLAIVAVGGGLSANAEVYFNSENKEFDCSGDQNLCSEITGPLYTARDQQGQMISDPSAFFSTEKYAVQ